MITRYSLLNPENAVDYVSNYFANGGEFVAINYVGLSKEDTGGVEALDVGFTYDGVDSVFTIWIETRADGSEYLYGEW